MTKIMMMRLGVMVGIMLTLVAFVKMGLIMKMVNQVRMMTTDSER